eukprot:CAMPEP_0117518306 /NCGR_PEP_ID=MMETSP0784-20121206/32063_1 /TAXON_ID=39447 /ORGANISM="" /LENGTH=705 /DNA_ID=CAMNT_0005314221 /DNA_START=1 /DNA_END=2118 /DNA_ORIENTATION=-
MQTVYELAVLLCLGVARAGLVPLRPPCAPLNVVSPYQSTWSCTSNLFDSFPQHWAGQTVGMYGMVKVDGQAFRLLGGPGGAGAGTPPVQTSVVVAPTTTTYSFDAGGVSLKLHFTTPAIGLDEDIVSASRPITHVTFEVAASDGKAHDVQLYYDNSAEGAVMSVDERVTWFRPKAATVHDMLAIMQIGVADQKPLAQGSDTINWGYWIVATPKAAAGVHTVMSSDAVCRGAFLDGSYFGLSDDSSGPRPAKERWPLLSVAWDLGRLSPGFTQQRHLVLAYDQVVSQRYFGTDMAPLWRNTWPDAVALLEAVEVARDQDLAATKAFDDKLVADLTAAGGDKYATLASLVYRQVLGGTQAVWNPVLKEAWVFMKEISSDGDVSTVDVVYPAFPMFQYLYPEYFRRTLIPLLVYGNNETASYGVDIPYNLAWAPHHLGHWPICDLRPERQEQMPVEESGNMLIMLAGLYKEQRSLSYLAPYWHMLDTWADFIVDSLPDPGSQLCTDDFEGPSPHNTNLAAKGIVALEAYSGLLRAKGDDEKAERYLKQASGFASAWVANATDGDHYRIQFDLPGTWSQKYNLLYQKVLGLKAFPQSVFDEEEKYYHTKMEVCGVALDNRHQYTKSDWSLWSASLATSQSQFNAIVDGVFNFANTTPSRVPLSDWYDVTTCTAKGFRARPVQGGLYAKMLVPRLEQDAPIDSHPAVLRI